MTVLPAPGQTPAQAATVLNNLITGNSIAIIAIGPAGDQNADDVATEADAQEPIFAVGGVNVAVIWVQDPAVLQDPQLAATGVGAAAPGALGLGLGQLHTVANTQTLADLQANTVQLVVTAMYGAAAGQ